MNTAENRAFWDQQASLGEKAGTQDLILKELEQRAILGEIGPNRHANVLEVGCGLGETARLVSRHMRVGIDAVDSSPEMIAKAKSGPPCDVFFEVGDVMSLRPDKYDVVYSQRCLINLPSWEAQKQAIDAIANVLVSGGRFLMVEASQQALYAINGARRLCGLAEIERPWHNIYVDDVALEDEITSLRLVDCVPFSAAYYYHSRVLNAALSDPHQPAYDAPINQMALTLPWTCVDARFSQSKLWIWQKP